MPNHNQMNTLKYLTLFFTFILFCLIPISKLKAEDWNYQMGINAARFRYVSPSGLSLNSFQPDAGLHLSILRSNRLINPSKTKSRFLKKLDYQIGLDINQYNAVGVTQNVPFSYTSTFVGVKLGIGSNTNLGRGLNLAYRAQLQANKMVLGSQKMGNEVYNLQGNSQFERIQWQLGGEVKLSKKINSQVATFIFFSEAWQVNKSQVDGSQFAINPTSFGFGIQYSILK
jgi:hypothetical protein